MIATRSRSNSEKSSIWPLRGFFNWRAEPPCPRQSIVATAKPRSSTAATTSKIFLDEFRAALQHLHRSARRRRGRAARGAQLHAVDRAHGCDEGPERGGIFRGRDEMHRGRSAKQAGLIGHFPRKCAKTPEYSAPLSPSALQDAKRGRLRGLRLRRGVMSKSPTAQNSSQLSAAGSGLRAALDV